MPLMPHGTLNLSQQFLCCCITCHLHSCTSELAGYTPKSVSLGHVAYSGLLCAGTVEERIFELQDWKSEVVDRIMGQSDLNSAANSKLTKDEMHFLLGHRDSLGPNTAQAVSQRPQVL